MKLVFATNNAHKLEEARAILGESVEVLSLNDLIAMHPDNPHCAELSDIPETADTLEGNSMQKAQYVYERFGVDCFADDTGLEIDALGGAPGVYTARWWSMPSEKWEPTDGHDVPGQNRKKALVELAGQTDRAARFRTVVTLIRGGKAEQVSGQISGQIAEAEYGGSGFGYDPVFIPEGHKETFAEMPAELKNGMSHRGRALEKMKHLLMLFACLMLPWVYSAADEYKPLSTAEMLGFALHYSYQNVEHIALTPTEVYALSGNALFSVNRKTEEITCHNTLTGLHSNQVSLINYDEQTHTLLVVYNNGLIDLIKGDDITYIADLYNKQMQSSKEPKCIRCHNGKAYMGMVFGMLVVDIHRAEIASTYYIGENSSEVEVKNIGFRGDSIFANCADGIRSADLKTNLVDYHNWNSATLSPTDSALIFATNDKTIINGKETWRAAGQQGLMRETNEGISYFLPSGPAINKPYRMYFFGDRLYVVPGGRWAVQYDQDAYVMILDGTEWTNILTNQIRYEAGLPDPRDYMSVAEDPRDKNHFFVASYGSGLHEYKDNHLVKIYTSTNSTIHCAVDESFWQYYTRTDGAIYDEKGNLWVMSASLQQGGYSVNIMEPNGTWHGINPAVAGRPVHYEIPGEICIDNRNPQRKYLAECRTSSATETGITTLDDGGTPWDEADDRVVHRSSWKDQNGKEVKPTYIYCYTQDKNGDLWIGTDMGPIIIPASTDPFTSNACRRIIINRTDGSGLADYLLGDERINAIAVDGGNRKWIGTASSGIFLMDGDSAQHTIYHFTDKNSPLPSSGILSIAIHPTTGEVFIGTEGGLVSFRSDASEPKKEASNVYVFPNPVRPNFDGYVSITGLMMNSEIRITDAGGNLVYKTTSNGGTAIWDMHNMAGRRVSPGVYLIFCNAEEGHTMRRVLIM